MSSSITNPTQMVEEFKKSGEFDRLRRQLLKEFRQSEGVAAFLTRVEDIAKQKLASDPQLQYMPEANVSREIMQELDRYPIVERAVQDFPLLSDPVLANSMRESMRKILQENRTASGQTNTNGTSQAAAQGGSAVSGNAAASGPRQDGNDSDSDSSAVSMEIEDYSSD
ncbi:complex proteins associated with Set1p component shg1-domain-containing protein [Fomes fomentarius]|nr:complex proteins associated with Set1p component shg1-domain-containing protein [Fomes fomentarius]